MPRDSGESIFAARHEDASQGPLSAWTDSLKSGKIGEISSWKGLHCARVLCGIHRKGMCAVSFMACLGNQPTPYRGHSGPPGPKMPKKSRKCLQPRDPKSLQKSPSGFASLWFASLTGLEAKGPLDFNGFRGLRNLCPVILGVDTIFWVIPKVVRCTG